MGKRSRRAQNLFELDRLEIRDTPYWIKVRFRDVSSDDTRFIRTKVKGHPWCPAFLLPRQADLA